MVFNYRTLVNESMIVSDNKKVQMFIYIGFVLLETCDRLHRNKRTCVVLKIRTRYFFGWGTISTYLVIALYRNVAAFLSPIYRSCNKGTTYFFFKTNTIHLNSSRYKQLNAGKMVYTYPGEMKPTKYRTHILFSNLFCI